MTDRSIVQMGVYTYTYMFESLQTDDKEETLSRHCCLLVLHILAAVDSRICDSCKRPCSLSGNHDAPAMDVGRCVWCMEAEPPQHCSGATQIYAEHGAEQWVKPDPQNGRFSSEH